jgi:hypothetical protein
MSGPKPDVQQAIKPGTITSKKSAPKLVGVKSNELDLNEGVVYTAGGIGVKKNQSKPSALSGGSNRVNSIASVGLNNPTVLRPPSSCKPI